MRNQTIITSIIASGLLFTGAACTSSVQDSEQMQRGKYLVETVVACGNCHSPKNPDGTSIEGMTFAGGFVIEEPGFRAYAPNITMDVETGIGSWSDEDIVRAIREGLRPDDTVIGPPMPNIFYKTMSDTDVNAIVAYMKTYPPVKNIVPKSEYRVPLPPNWGPPAGVVPDVPTDDPVAYGRYVTHTLGHCTDCHTPIEKGQFDFSRTGLGGRLFDNIFDLGFVTTSRNITPHKELGIGQWTDAEIKRAVTEGVSRDGSPLAKSMAFPYYKKMTEQDLDAMVAYLRSIKPLP